MVLPLGEVICILRNVWLLLLNWDVVIKLKQAIMMVLMQLNKTLNYDRLWLAVTVQIDKLSSQVNVGQVPLTSITT